MHTLYQRLSFEQCIAAGSNEEKRDHFYDLFSTALKGTPLNPFALCSLAPIKSGRSFGPVFHMKFVLGFMPGFLGFHRNSQDVYPAK